MINILNYLEEFRKKLIVLDHNFESLIDDLTDLRDELRININILKEERRKKKDENKA